MVAFAGVVSVSGQQVTPEVPGAARITTGRPAALSFEDAIKLAINNNLATLLAHERRNEAR